MADPIPKNGARQSNPAFQFYPSDYMESEDVRCMDWDVKGVYVEMLCLAWQNVGLPSDVARVAMMLRSDQVRLEGVLDGPLGNCWEERDGRMFNPRMERERDRMGKVSDAASEAGKKGAAKRWGKESAVEPQNALDDSENGVAIATPLGSPSIRQCTPNGEPIAPSPAQPSPAQPSSSTKGAIAPMSPSAPVEPKVQRGKLVSVQLQMLAQEFALRDDATEAFEAWRVYRIEIGKQLTQSSARKLAKRAAEHPDEFIRDVGHSIEQGYQGIFAPKDAGQAVAANGSMPKNLSFRIQDKLMDQHHDDEWDRMVEQFEPRNAEIEETR